MSDHFAAFLAIAVLVIVTPGQDMALVMRNTLLGGRGRGVTTGVGVALGLAVWAFASARPRGSFLRLTLTWLVLYAAFIARIGDGLRHPVIRRALESLVGAVLVTLGLRLAFEHR